MKRPTLKQTERLLWILALGAIGIYWLGACLELTRIFAWLALAVLVLDLVLVWLFYRCPHCNSYLGRIGTQASFCPHCGKELPRD